MPLAPCADVGGGWKEDEQLNHSTVVQGAIQERGEKGNVVVNGSSSSGEWTLFSVDRSESPEGCVACLDISSGLQRNRELEGIDSVAVAHVFE